MCFVGGLIQRGLGPRVVQTSGLVAYELFFISGVLDTTLVHECLIQIIRTHLLRLVHIPPILLRSVKALLGCRLFKLHIAQLLHRFPLLHRCKVRPDVPLSDVLLLSLHLARVIGVATNVVLYCLHILDFVEVGKLVMALDVLGGDPAVVLALGEGGFGTNLFVCFDEELAALGGSLDVRC